MTDTNRGRELLALLRSVNDTVERTIRSESPGILDRAQIVARFTMPFTRAIADNPSYASLAKLAGARRLAARTWSAAQRQWFVAGENDALADRKLADDIQREYDRLLNVNRDALAAEEKWMRLPENIADQAVAVFFKGLLDTLDRWIRFLGAPFGIPWDLLILAGVAVLGVVLFKKAT